MHRSQLRLRARRLALTLLLASGCAPTPRPGGAPPAGGAEDHAAAEATPMDGASALETTGDLAAPADPGAADDADTVGEPPAGDEGAPELPVAPDADRPLTTPGSYVFVTSGGGTLASPGHRLHLFVVPGTPVGRTTSPLHRLTLGPVAPIMAAQEAP